MPIRYWILLALALLAGLLVLRAPPRGGRPGPKPGAWRTIKPVPPPPIPSGPRRD